MTDSYSSPRLMLLNTARVSPIPTPGERVEHQLARGSRAGMTDITVLGRW